MNKKKYPGLAVVAWLARWGTISLIALRACDVISWPWYALLSPLFSYFVWLLLCAAIVGIKAVEDGL